MLENPIGISSSRHKKTPSASPPIGTSTIVLSPNSTEFFVFSCASCGARPLSQCLFEQTIFYVHFRASPPMSGDNHRVPPVELALLSSMLAKASAGPRCGDCGRTESRDGWPGRWGPTCSVPTVAFVAGMPDSGGTGVLSRYIKSRFPSHCCTKGWCAGGVPERLGWSHMAAVALHSAIYIKCTCRVDCPEELRCTTVPVPAPPAGGVTSCLSIDVKCARHFECPGELMRTAIPFATRSLAIDVKCARHTDYPRELRRTTIPLPAR
jgi:hypothetical protein